MTLTTKKPPLWVEFQYDLNNGEFHLGPVKVADLTPDAHASLNALAKSAGQWSFEAGGGFHDGEACPICLRRKNP